MAKAYRSMTGPEAACQHRQVREKRCAACKHSVVEGHAFGTPVHRCGKGLVWPRKPGAVCFGFELLEVDE